MKSEECQSSSISLFTFHFLLFTRHLSLGRLERKRDAVDGSAVNFNIFTDWFAAVWSGGNAIPGKIRREAKHKSTKRVGNTPVDLFGAAVCFDAREVNGNAGSAAVIFVEDAAANKSNRALVNREHQAIAERARLARFDFNVFDGAN